MSDVLLPAKASDTFLADVISNMSPGTVRRLDLGATLITCGSHPTMGNVVCINPCSGDSAVVTTEEVLKSHELVLAP